MMTISKLYLLRCRFWLLAPFLLRGLTWAILAQGPKTNLKISERVPAFPFNSYLKIKFFKIIGLTPLKLRSKCEKDVICSVQ